MKVDRNNQKKNYPIFKMGRGLEQPFLQEEVQMAKKHMKRYSTSLVIREMQIKTTMRCYFTPTRMAAIKEKNRQ